MSVGVYKGLDILFFENLINSNSCYLLFFDFYECVRILFREI